MPKPNEFIRSINITSKAFDFVREFSYQTADGVVPWASQTVHKNLNATPLCVRLRNRVYAYLLYASVLQWNVEIEKLMSRIYGTNRERPRTYHDGWKIARVCGRSRGWSRTSFAQGRSWEGMMGIGPSQSFTETCRRPLFFGFCSSFFRFYLGWFGFRAPPLNLPLGRPVGLGDEKRKRPSFPSTRRTTGIVFCAIFRAKRQKLKPSRYACNVRVCM